MSNARVFLVPLLLTAGGLLAGAGLGYAQGHTAASALSTAFVCGVLGILEVSLSLDNAIVNARVLGGMEAIWRRRFLTWGILIAVVGMRVLFPLAIVAVAGGIGPVRALRLAIADPDEYARVLTGARVSISAFGGSFLLMVAFRFFFDTDKRVHWVAGLEARLARLGNVEGIELALVLALMLAISAFEPAGDVAPFLRAAMAGLVTFVAVGSLEHLFRTGRDAAGGAVRSGLAAFVSLEVLDASFSFDAVIGAYALSRNVLVIAIGLGIGASFVRALTVLMVDKGVLGRYRFLEHGAFYAILALALFMVTQTIAEVPDVATGLIGAGLVVLALVSSMAWSRRHPGADASH